MTEAEAKTKWCPMARIALEAQAGNALAMTSVNSFTEKHGAKDTRSMCVASACMMWRVETAQEPIPENEIPPENKLGILEGVRWVRNKQIGGYCGLAGKP